MPQPDQRPKISVEDLLRLKRAERPAPDFWSAFERELRQKQLAALVEKRSWWQYLPRLALRRAYIPAGATAVLAFTLVSVRYYAPTQVAQVDRVAVADTVVAVNDQATPALAVQADPLNQSSVASHPEAALATVGQVVALPAQPVAASAPEIAPAATMQASVDRPSARSFAANLARLEQSEPELLNAVLGSRLSAISRDSDTARPAVELAAFASVGSKRARLLANYNDRQSNPTPSAPDIVRERLSRRLGDAELYDRFGRVGVHGNQVSLKF